MNASMSSNICELYKYGMKQLVYNRLLGLL